MRQPSRPRRRPVWHRRRQRYVLRIHSASCAVWFWYYATQKAALDAARPLTDASHAYELVYLWTHRTLLTWSTRGLMGATA